MTPNSIQEGQTAIIHGQTAGPLAQEISDYLKIPIVKHKVGRYPDGETFAEINENVRGQNVIFIGSTPDLKNGLKPNDVLFEFVAAGDALRRSKVKSIDLLIPYLPFEQSDLRQSRYITTNYQVAIDTIMQIDPRHAFLMSAPAAYQGQTAPSLGTLPWFENLHASNLRRLKNNRLPFGTYDFEDGSSKANSTVIMYGRGSKELAKGIGGYLGIPIAEHSVGENKRGETIVRFKEDVYGKNVIFIGSPPDPTAGISPNDVIMEYAYVGRALRKAGAASYHNIVRYIPYARQDRTKGARVGLTSKRAIDIMMMDNPEGVLLVEPHTEYLELAFPPNNPPDILWFTNLFAVNIAKLVRDIAVDPQRVVPIAADHGTLVRVAQLTKILHDRCDIDVNPNLVMAQKKRLGPEKTELMSFTGGNALKRALAIIPDDILASGGTMINAATAAKTAGADKEITAADKATIVAAVKALKDVLDSGETSIIEAKREALIQTVMHIFDEQPDKSQQKADAAPGASVVICTAAHGSLTRDENNIPKILHELNKPNSVIDLVILADTLPIPDEVRNHPLVVILSSAQCIALAAHNAWGIPYPGKSNGHAGSLRGFNQGEGDALTPQPIPIAKQKALAAKLAA